MTAWPHCSHCSKFTEKVWWCIYAEGTEAVNAVASGVTVGYSDVNCIDKGKRKKRISQRENACGEVKDFRIM